MSFWGTSALGPGVRHLLHRRNCQDKAFYGEVTIGGNTYRYGGSLDGLGSGGESEFGAILAADFLLWEIPRQIAGGVALTDLPKEIFESLRDELRRVLPTHRPAKEVARFVLNKLLFTTFVFVQGPDETVIFHLGDGVICVNGELVIDTKDDDPEGRNEPDCLGYILIPRLDPRYFEKYKKSSAKSVYQPRTAFNVLHYATADIWQIMVGSDAWHDELELLKRLASLLPDMEAEYANEVQEQITVWMGQLFRDPATQKYHFEDDVSVAVLQRAGVSAKPEVTATDLTPEEKGDTP